ncbi:MAG: LacI family DNA-binding transcriptional regulator [Eubacteriales bacterium]|nr:LacI family DNA-binding transcriptional regulator [Eubacteriales bacterium]
MTLKEIAQEAGVSISTVSRVVNKNAPGAASKEVQDKIWEIVRRTGYTPNSTARTLKLGEETAAPASRSIACMFARSTDTVTDLFFTSLARSIEQEAFKRNYVLKYSFSAFDINHPNTFRLITDNHVDGVVILGRCDKPMLKMLKQYFNYVAYTGLNYLDARYDQIICDGYAAAQAAVNYLIDMGHRKIAYIGETQSESRYNGYCDALNARRISFWKGYTANVSLSLESGYQGAKRLIDTGCDATAYFCANDITAIGAMRALQETGLSIPRDVSVISIDDIETAQYLNPMLTTVHIPVEEMGQMTAKTLIDRIEGGHKLPMKVALPFYIATRDSCAPPRFR